MGCWDVFCFICGNPCHSMIGTIENVTEYFNMDIKSSYSPFMKKEIKKIKEYPNIVNNLKILDKEIQWMNRCTMLQTNDMIIHGVKEKDCNVIFCKKNNCIEHINIGTEFSPFTNTGIFIHTDCWKYIKTNYNIKLKFSHLPPINLKNIKKIFDIKYGDIEKYWEQDFDFTSIVINEEQFLCSSPLKKDKNIAQINSNIRKLKLKNDPDRKAPQVSATFYKEGDIKIGNNMKFHIIKGKKWVEINEKIIKTKIILNINILTKKQEKYIVKIPNIGEHNTEPIFIISVKKINKNKTEMEFIMTENYNGIFNKMISAK